MPISTLMKRFLPLYTTGQRRSVWAGLFAPAEMQRILARERGRADRNSDHFSLLVFTVGSRWRNYETHIHLVHILQSRLRWTDEAGWLDRYRVAVVLPSTPAQGAWILADDICLAFPADIRLPACNVYVYPSPRPAPCAHRNYDRANGQEERTAVPTALDMAPLFHKEISPVKRVIDIFGSLLGLVLLTPLFLVAAAAVKLSSPGPVFFQQWRTGRGGKPFVLYKFRTMHVDAEHRKSELMHLNEQDGPAFKITADPRITRVGRFLRSTSIDELPQLWNVLRGEMTLVGPRPLVCREAEACRGWLRHRMDVTPGLTCIWQVHGRSRVSFVEWIRMDLRYIRHRSLGLDLKLILQTVSDMLLKRNGR